MKLLLIISQFSPAQTPNTMRWIPLLRFFQDQGHDVYVLTTKRSGQPLESVEDNMAIFRAGYNTLLDFCFDLTKRSNRRNETGNKGYSGTPGLGSVLLEKLVSKTWRKNYWPDGSKLFLKPGIKKGLEIVEDKQISHIISVGLPFTAHLIAQKLKEKNAAINWHMDIQDPFCYSKEFWVNNFKKYSAKNIAAEKAAFHLADSISNTNATADQKYKILFPEAKDKMTIIPPLFALPKSKDNKGLYLFDEKIHLGYFGSFYDGVRSPKPFLDFLLDLHKVDPTLFDKIQIHFFGQQNRFSAPLFSAYPTIRRYFILHGYVDRDTSINAMQKMDVLLNFGNTTDYHLPSKVVDLLYINKPIVNFTAHKNDTTQVFLADYDPILNINLSDKTTNYNDVFLDFILKKRSETQVAFHDMKQYLPENIGEQYIKAIE